MAWCAATGKDQGWTGDPVNGNGSVRIWRRSGGGPGLRRKGIERFLEKNDRSRNHATTDTVIKVESAATKNGRDRANQNVGKCAGGNVANSSSGIYIRRVWN